jgi:hypothetical protein
MTREAPSVVETVWSLVAGYWAIVLPALYLAAMRWNPAAASLRDGYRAVRRYRMLWVPLGVCGLAYALFQLAVRLYFHLVLPAGEKPGFQWWSAVRPIDAAALLPLGREALLPALENTAGIFNSLVSTFPLAALAAVLLLFNIGGHHVVLWRALWRRFGRAALLLHAGIVLCALAAVAKPLLYIVARHVDPLLWYQWSPVVAWLAFLFEYLLGVCIQVYLILMAYCWVRGIAFAHGHLLDFAIRRCGSVLKWAAVVMLLSSAFIDLPLILKNFAPFTGVFTDDPVQVEFRVRLARSMLAGFLLATSTVQITLIFHSESLRAALRDHLRFLRRHWWPCVWFLALAALHFFLLELLRATVQASLGEGTAPGIAWQLFHPWLAAMVAAWLLASWVCLYRRCDAGRKIGENWIAF